MAVCQKPQDTSKLAWHRAFLFLLSSVFSGEASGLYLLGDWNKPAIILASAKLISVTDFPKYV